MSRTNILSLLMVVGTLIAMVLVIVQVARGTVLEATILVQQQRYDAAMRSLDSLMEERDTNRSRADELRRQLTEWRLGQGTLSPEDHKKLDGIVATLTEMAGK